MACNYQRNSSGEIVAAITDSGQQCLESFIHEKMVQHGGQKQ